jgi:hypothetical protein
VLIEERVRIDEVLVRNRRCMERIRFHWKESGFNWKEKSIVGRNGQNGMLLIM